MTAHNNDSEFDANAHAGPELSPNDKRLVDALVDGQYDRASLGDFTDAERQRVDALMNLFGLLRDYPVDDPDETLIHATLARIDRHENARVERMAIATAEESSMAKRPRIGFRMPDLIAVAASLLLVASVAVPVIHSMRQRSIDLNCANNLRLLGYGFGHYAADNRGFLPTVQSAAVGGTWEHFSNAVNLGPLLQGQYCSHGHLRCPGNHDNLEMSYSYQWQQSDKPSTWGGERVTVVIGDRNPVMDAARRGRIIPALTMSPDHGGKGQNVLTTDGAAIWVDGEPVIGGSDNIWLPHGMQQLVPGALPRDRWDVFLGH
jgi:hypothetical protein